MEKKQLHSTMIIFILLAQLMVLTGQMDLQDPANPVDPTLLFMNPMLMGYQRPTVASNGPQPPSPEQIGQKSETILPSLENSSENRPAASGSSSQSDETAKKLDEVHAAGTAITSSVSGVTSPGTVGAGENAAKADEAQVTALAEAEAKAVAKAEAAATDGDKAAAEAKAEAAATDEDKAAAEAKAEAAATDEDKAAAEAKAEAAAKAVAEAKTKAKPIDEDAEEALDEAAEDAKKKAAFEATAQFEAVTPAKVNASSKGSTTVAKVDTEEATRTLIKKINSTIEADAAAEARAIADLANATINANPSRNTDPVASDTTEFSKGDNFTSEALTSANFLNPITCQRTRYCHINASGLDLQLVDYRSAMQDLAAEIIKKLKRPDENILIAPASIMATLMMAEKLSDKNTKKQMDKVMGIEKYHLQNVEYKILHEYNKKKMDYKSVLSHRLLLQKGHAVNRDLHSKVKQLEGSVEILDFVHRGPEATRKINGWVSARTDGKVPELMNEPLYPPPQLLLESIAFFSAPFRIPFLSADTTEGDFQMMDGTKKKVSLMVLRNQRFHYTDDENTHHQFLELPYSSKWVNPQSRLESNTSLLIALPELNAEELHMTGDMLCYVLSRLRATAPILLEQVVLPKLRLDYQTKLDGSLRSLGMTDLFEGDKASLPHISKAHRFHVSGFIHKAVVDIEEGQTSPPIPEEKTADSDAPTFAADRPFLLYIVDMDRKNILFSGSVSDPLA